MSSTRSLAHHSDAVPPLYWLAAERAILTIIHALEAERHVFARMQLDVHVRAEAYRAQHLLLELLNLGTQARLLLRKTSVLVAYPIRLLYVLAHAPCLSPRVQDSILELVRSELLHQLLRIVRSSLGVLKELIGTTYSRDCWSLGKVEPAPPFPFKNRRLGQNFDERLSGRHVGQFFNNYSISPYKFTTLFFFSFCFLNDQK